MAATHWHSDTAEQVAVRLGSALDCGLPDAVVQARRAEFGPNTLYEKPPRPVWLKFFDQFRSVLIMVLLAAAVIAGLVGDLHDAVVILVVVLINAGLGFYQEYRAEAALAALKAMLAPLARVRRGGLVQQVPAAELVPGDVLLLEAGDRIPADARVCLAHAAEVAEAALTGESHAVVKQSLPVSLETILAERSCMVYMNTVVTRGRLEALVVATGMQTETGRLAGLLAEASESATPLQTQLDLLGKRLAAIAGGVVGLIFILGLVRGDALLNTAMTAIALAVAAIPEGLPAVVTVTLALGMRRMAGQQAIIKRLAAVETLGCTTVICSDKTGTLTLNQMMVRQFYFAGTDFSVDGDGYAGNGLIATVHGEKMPKLEPFLLPFLTPAALCADAHIDHGELIGDPTEGALLALAAKGGVMADELALHSPRIAEIPFDSGHKFMATFHHDGNVVQMWVKGAPDVLLARATQFFDGVAEQPLDSAASQLFNQKNANFAEQAMRVLALAGRRIPAEAFDPAGDLMGWVDQLCLIGLAGIIDPPRPAVHAAIALCQAAGIEVKMITGDHRLTAAAIARDLGLRGEVHEGQELLGLESTALRQLVERTAVFARVSPEHKMWMVEALQQGGHVVAMTGDGINDAPALKAADIGIAMGLTGTAVTREAADLVLADDNFASIVGAVKEGRTIYDNIVKFVRFQLSTNIGALLTVLAAPLFVFPTPFTAIQILWVNIIMDGPPAMTLGVEPPRAGIMAEDPRGRSAAILSGGRLLNIVLAGLTMAAGTLAAYAWGLAQGGSAYAMTLAFTTFVLFQFFNIFNARAEHDSTFNRQFFSNGKLWLALISVLLLQILVVHWAPAQSLFATVSLDLADWLLSIGIAASVLLLEELRKLARTIIRWWKP